MCNSKPTKPSPLPQLPTSLLHSTVSSTFYNRRLAVIDNLGMSAGELTYLSSFLNSNFLHKIDVKEMQSLMICDTTLQPLYA